MALALAGLELGGAITVAKRRTAEANPEIEMALAAYAVGVLGGTIAAAAFGLGEAWLTVALAAHLPAIGWVEIRIRVAALRWVALAIASAVLVRLVLNPYVLEYPLGGMPIVNWILYGYGRAGRGLHPRHPAIRRQQGRRPGLAPGGGQRRLLRSCC